VVDGEGVVQSREITLAEELEQVYVVASGLSADDLILLEGLRQVKDGEEIATRYLEPSEVVAHLEAPAE
jgi:membrane fusion protein (multidrug efflux system)